MSPPAPIGAFLFLIAGAAAGDGTPSVPDVAHVFEEARRGPGALSGYHCRWSDISDTYTLLNRYTYSGGRVRSESIYGSEATLPPPGEGRGPIIRRLDKSWESPPGTIVTYDGERWYKFDRKIDELLIRSDTAPFGSAAPPVVLLYEWLLNSGEPRDWTSWRDPRLWDRRAATATVVGAGERDGRRVVTVRVRIDEPPRLADVSFAPDAGWLPVRVETFKEDDPDYRGIQRVTDSESFEVDGVRVELPTRIEVDGVSGQRIVYTVEEQRLDPRVEPDRFVLTQAETGAEIVDDVDAGTVEMVESGVVRTDLNEHRRPPAAGVTDGTAWWAWAVGAGLLCVAVFLFLRFRTP